MLHLINNLIFRISIQHDEIKTVSAYRSSQKWRHNRAERSNIECQTVYLVWHLSKRRLIRNWKHRTYSDTRKYTKTIEKNARSPID